MNNSRAAITAENKKHIERQVQEIGDERGLEGLSTKWEDPPDTTMGTYKLSVHVPEYDSVVITFEANDLRWKTYYMEDEKKSQRFESYERRQKWDAQIRQVLSVGFGGGPIGFSS